MSIKRVFEWLKDKGIAEKFNENHDEHGRFASSGTTSRGSEVQNLSRLPGKSNSYAPWVQF